MAALETGPRTHGLSANSLGTGPRVESGEECAPEKEPPPPTAWSPHPGKAVDWSSLHHPGQHCLRRAIPGNSPGQMGPGKQGAKRGCQAASSSPGSVGGDGAVRRKHYTMPITSTSHAERTVSKEPDHHRSPISQRGTPKPEVRKQQPQPSALLPDFRVRGQGRGAQPCPDSGTQAAPGRGHPSWGWFLLFPVQGRNCHCSQISPMPAPHFCPPA